MDSLFSMPSLVEVVIFLIGISILELIWLFWPLKRKKKEVNTKSEPKKTSLHTPSLDGFMSFRRTWKWLVIISWSVFLISVFVATFISWTAPYPSPPERSNLVQWIVITPLVIAFLITGIPLWIALFYSDLRKKLFSSPGMIAGGLFIGTFFLSFILLVILGMPWTSTDISSLFSITDLEFNHFLETVLEPILTGYFIGIIAFPLTFGLVFPLGIPILCAFLVRSTLNKHHKMPLWGWSLSIVVSTLGWMLVSVVGYALGNA